MIRLFYFSHATQVISDEHARLTVASTTGE